MDQIQEFVAEEIVDSGQFHSVIQEATKLKNQCDLLSPDVHDHRDCINSARNPDCPRALICLVVRVIAYKAALYDDKAKDIVDECVKLSGVRVTGLITKDILKLLSTKSPNSQTMVWIKYELFLRQMIKARIYSPEDMANELLAVIKHDLEPSLSLKLSSALKSCVDLCRQISNRHEPDKEEKEKWCEIIDWMSWMMSGADDDLD